MDMTLLREPVIAALAAAVPVLLILLIALTLSHLKLKKRLDSFMGSRSDKHNLEAMLREYLDGVRYIHDGHERTLAAIRDINDRLENCIQRVGIVRYNPFNDMGGDLSFTLALLDERGDGVVLNVIRSRDLTYTYGKPIVANAEGQNLTDEEIEAIRQAWGKKAVR